MADQPNPQPQPPAKPPAAPAGDAALLKSLGMTEPELVDPLKETPADLDIPDAQTTGTPVQRADAVHATKYGGKGYLVRFKGEYLALADQTGSSRNKVNKPYEVDVVLPEIEMARSIFKGTLGLPAVRKKHPEAIRLRTYHIVDVKALDPNAPETKSLEYASRPRLLAYVESANVPIDLKNPDYDRTEVLRATLIDFRLNPRDFEKREAARVKKRKQARELATLNPDLAGEILESASPSAKAG